MLTNKKISVFTLVMINLIAIDSLRSIPISAEYGWALIFVYLAGAITFFIPSALVVAELASAWPEEGGLYYWIKISCGKPIGFMVITLQWIYNICWYPTILALFAATVAYLIYPPLVNNKGYMLTVILASYWLITWVNTKGIRASGYLSNFSAVLGIIFPLVLISILGIIWLATGHNLQIKFTTHKLLPDWHNPEQLIFLSTIIYSLLGVEISAYHAKDVKDPAKDYPKAILYSAIFILSSLIISSLAVAIVVPHKLLEKSLIDGLLVAFDKFFISFHIAWMTPVIAVLIAIGTIGGVGAWVIGPSKGLLAAAKDQCVPQCLQKTNNQHAPITILMLQGIIFSILCAVYILMPTVNSGFFILSNLTSQLALFSYLFIFAAGLILRYKYPDKFRPYRVPGKKIFIWIISVLGVITCVTTIILSFLPPKNIDVGNIIGYESLLLGGFAFFIIAPLLVYYVYQKIN